MPINRRRSYLLLVESALIVASILLAFALNGWWEARQERQLAERAITAFEQEITRNRDNLRQVMPYHLALQERLGELTRAGSIRTMDDFVGGGFEGFKPPLLATTAWRSALATGALAHMDYDMVAELSAVYTVQELFAEASNPRFVQDAGAWTEENIPSTMFTAILYLGDVTAIAPELVRMYQQVLMRIDARRGR